MFEHDDGRWPASSGTSSASVARVAYRWAQLRSPVFLVLEPMPSPPQETKGSSHRGESTEPGPQAEKTLVWVQWVLLIPPTALRRPWSALEKVSARGQPKTPPFP